MVKEGNKNLPPARDVPIKPVKVIGNTMGGISIGGIGAGLGFWHEMCLTEVGTAMHNFAGTLTNFAGNADEHVGKLLEKMVTLPIDPIKFGIGVTAAAAVFLNRREISLAIRKVFDKAARKHVERVATSKEDAAWEAYQEKTRTAIQNGTGNETDVYRDLPEEQKDLVNAWRKRHKQPSATERSNPASPERSDRDTFNYWLNQFNNEAQQFDAVFLRARQQQGVGVNPRVDAIMASLHRASYFFDQLSKAHQNVRDINDSLKTTFDTAFMKYQDMVSRSQVFTGILSNRADRERYPYATMPRLYNSTGEIRPEDLDRLSNGYQAGRRLAYEQKHFSFDQLSQTIRNGNQYSQQDVNMVIDRLYRDGIIDYEGGNGYKLADSQNQVGLHQPEQPPPLAQTEPDNLSDKDRLKAARKQLRARERAITKQQNKEAWQSFGDDLLTLINIPQHVKYVFYDLPKNLIDSHQTDLVKEYTDVPKEYMRTYESMSARADETSLGRTYWNLCDLKYRENTQYTVVLSKAGLLPGTIKMLKEMHDTMVSFHRDAIYKYNELRKYIRDTARRSVAGGYQPPQYQGYPEGYQGYPEGYQGYYAGYPGQYQPQHPPYPPTTPEFTHPPESFNSQPQPLHAPNYYSAPNALRNRNSHNTYDGMVYGACKDWFRYYNLKHNIPETGNQDAHLDVDYPWPPDCPGKTPNPNASQNYLVRHEQAYINGQGGAAYDSKDCVLIETGNGNKERIGGFDQETGLSQYDVVYESQYTDKDNRSGTYYYLNLKNTKRKNGQENQKTTDDRGVYGYPFFFADGTYKCYNTDRLVVNESVFFASKGTKGYATLASENGVYKPRKKGEKTEWNWTERYGYPEPEEGTEPNGEEEDYGDALDTGGASTGSGTGNGGNGGEGDGSDSGDDRVRGKRRPQTIPHGSSAGGGDANPKTEEGKALVEWIGDSIDQEYPEPEKPEPDDTVVADVWKTLRELEDHDKPKPRSAEKELEDETTKNAEAAEAKLNKTIELWQEEVKKHNNENWEWGTGHYLELGLLLLRQKENDEGRIGDIEDIGALATRIGEVQKLVGDKMGDFRTWFEKDETQDFLKHKILAVVDAEDKKPAP